MAKKKSTAAPAPYEVGRGKPPQATRFKPGQSGNPSGRKKGCRNLKSILATVMEGEIELTENGRKRRVTMLEAMLLRQVQEGLSGKLRAIENLLDRYERYGSTDEPHSLELPEEDEALLARVLAGRRSLLMPSTGREETGEGEHGSEEEAGDV